MGKRFFAGSFRTPDDSSRQSDLTEGAVGRHRGSRLTHRHAVRILKGVMSTRWNRLIAALALIPVFAMAVAASTLAMQCRVLGKVVASCCCPAKKMVASAEAQRETTKVTARLDRQSCCQIEQREALQPAAELVSSVALPAPDLGALRLSPPPARTSASTALARAEHRDPAPPPPLLLLKQSFLI